MAKIYTPTHLWRERLGELERDLYRLDALLDDDLIKQESGLDGKFRRSLGPLKAGAMNLGKEKGTDAELWGNLSALIRKCDEARKSQLEFLGCVAISRYGFDNGFAARAGEWLVGMRDRLGLDQRLSVIAGLGQLWEPDPGVVRLTFPDWDLWHLPLLGRALGLMALSDAKYREALDDSIRRFNDRIVGALRPRLNHAGKIDERARGFISHLFADMFAAAVLGPVYALAVFTLELDYSRPNQLELPDPDLIEGRETAPRFLPSPGARAAAILATLRAMNREDDPPSQRHYTQILKRVEEMWRSAIRSAKQPDFLDDEVESFRTWREAVYRDVIEPLGGAETERIWREALAWRQALRTAKWPEKLEPDITALAGAIYLHRLDYPDQAGNALALAEGLLRGERRLAPLEGTPAAVEKAIAQARVERMETRWKRLEAILKSDAITAEDRAAVAGRFYRILSRQIYKLDSCRLMIEDKARAGFWGKHAQLVDDMRPAQRETLEFLGGYLIRKRELDREPAQTPRLSNAGANVCKLADRLLQDYARRTGVNWNARTTLGTTPFLAMDTDLIRVRFPDWSLWNLPLMAHEFGHLAARSSPEFMEYQSQHPVRRSHLDEFFADIFATYTFGPAFACAVILLQFNPAEAFAERGSHPSHQERVRLIVQTLREMNTKTQRRNIYGRLLDRLEQTWNETTTACQAAPVDKAAFDQRLDESLRWGRGIFRIVDTYYSLGAAYRPEQWAAAQKISELLLKPSVPSRDKINEIAKNDLPGGATLCDTLNGLWVARARDPALGAGVLGVGHIIAHYYSEE
jgi:hypothetical protein